MTVPSRSRNSSASAAVLPKNRQHSTPAVHLSFEI
jgi:hypothetical protein